MGCNYSRIEREEMIKRCKARKKYMKQFLKSTKSLSSSHTLYLSSLKATGSSLLKFANTETTLPKPPPSDPQPPQLQPQPPTQMAAHERWDFWDSFVECSDGNVTVEKRKDLVEIVKQIDEYFVVAAESGAGVASILEISNLGFSNQYMSGKVYNCGRSLSPLTWTCGSNSNCFDKLGKQVVATDLAKDGAIINTNHFCTVEKLYVLEKKMYIEVKNGDATKREHEKKVEQLKNLESVKKIDNVKTEKIKKEVLELESRMVLASEAIDTISNEIVQLRESELYPQLIELVKGFTMMWKNMNECHRSQMQTIHHLKSLNTTPSIQSSHQLELNLNQWRISFCNLIKSQKDYIQSLTGWLRLSLFSFDKKTSSNQTKESNMYALCEKWRLSIDLVPCKLVEEGIQAFLTVTHDIVLQQEEEEKHRKKYETVFKELEKKTAELRLLEKSEGGKRQNMVEEKRAAVEILLAKAEEEKGKYAKVMGETSLMMLENLQMGFCNLFRVMTEFSSACLREFESVNDYGKTMDELNDAETETETETTVS